MSAEDQSMVVVLLLRMLWKSVVALSKVTLHCLYRAFKPIKATMPQDCTVVPESTGQVMAIGA